MIVKRDKTFSFKERVTYISKDRNMIVLRDKMFSDNKDKAIGAGTIGVGEHY